MLRKFGLSEILGDCSNCLLTIILLLVTFGYVFWILNVVSLFFSAATNLQYFVHIAYGCLIHTVKVNTDDLKKYQKLMIKHLSRHQFLWKSFCKTLYANFICKMLTLDKMEICVTYFLENFSAVALNSQNVSFQLQIFSTGLLWRCYFSNIKFHWMVFFIFYWTESCLNCIET